MAIIAQFIDNNLLGTTQEANNRVDLENNTVALLGYSKTNLYALLSSISYIYYNTDNNAQAQSEDYNDNMSSINSDNSFDNFDFINSADNSALYTNYFESDLKAQDDLETEKE